MSGGLIHRRRLLASRRKDKHSDFAYSPAAADVHARNCDSESFTERLQKAVPLLEFVEAKVEAVSVGRSSISAPLLQNAKNQNGTHQAAVFYILADYTLGLALFAAIPWVYVVDVHDPCECLPVQMWLLSGQVKHIAPGTGEIKAVAGLTTEQANKARQDFARKERCRVKGNVEFYQEGELIALAEHEVGMYRVASI